MINLPSKHSRKWLYIIATLFLLNFIALMAFVFILYSNITAQNVIGFSILSFVLAIIIAGGGFLGAKAYVFTAVIFDIIAIIYMMYASIGKISEGWSDLVSFISYLFIVGAGVLLGLVIQGVLFLVGLRKKG